MAKKKASDTPSIIIDGKPYPLDSLTENAKALLVSLEAVSGPSSLPQVRAGHFFKSLPLA